MIDINKTYRTMDGREVRIYATDGVGDYPIHGAMLCDKGWHGEYWTAQGETYSGRSHLHDLVEVKPRIQRELWINVYPDPKRVWAYHTKEDADWRAIRERLACVKMIIDCEEGEGL